MDRMITKNWCRMPHYRITQGQHCNNVNDYNDDNVVCATSVWLKSFLVYFNVNTCDIWEGHVITKGDIQIGNIRSLGFRDIKRRSDTEEVNITEFRVYIDPNDMEYHQLPIPCPLSKRILITDTTRMQCSRLKPSYEFHFEGLSNFNSSIKGLVRIQDVNLRILKWNTKLILNLCNNYIWYTLPIQCEESRINHLTPLLIMTVPYACWFLWWANILRTSCDAIVFNLGLSLEGLFWKTYYIHLKGPNRVRRALKTSVLNTAWMVSREIEKVLDQHLGITYM